MTQPKDGLYVGVDVGGTKTLAVVTTACGRILARKRTSTPRGAPSEQIVRAIIGTIRDLLRENDIPKKSLEGIGLAVPGVVGAGMERVVFAPNLKIAGVNLVAPLKREFRAPAALGNDVNLGTLGEKWLGAARSSASAVGIFVGTGIGGGIVHEGKLLTGHSGAAGEIGHMVVRMGGPRCGCGELGCLEALASRTAIERDLRQALAAGTKSVLTALVGTRPNVIKSSVLREALRKKDPLVRKVLTRAAEVLGRACVNIRHLIDPEIIILGGGVVEACGDFILPIVRRIVAADRLLEKVSRGRIVASELGDDAVALGAVALAQQAAGVDPFKAPPPALEHPRISRAGPGWITVDGRVYREDIVIRADGTIKKRRKLLDKIGADDKLISAAELQKVCKGDPGVLVIAAARLVESVALRTESAFGDSPGATGKRAARLESGARDFLRKRKIKVQFPPANQAGRVYNSIPGPKAAMILISN